MVSILIFCYKILENGMKIESVWERIQEMGEADFKASAESGSFVPVGSIIVLFEYTPEQWWTLSFHLIIHVIMILWLKCIYMGKQVPACESCSENPAM